MGVGRAGLLRETMQPAYRKPGGLRLRGRSRGFLVAFEKRQLQMENVWFGLNLGRSAILNQPVASAREANTKNTWNKSQGICICTLRSGHKH